MLIKNIPLDIDYAALGIETPSKAPDLTGYIIRNIDEFSAGRTRSAVLVLPGGGYSRTSEREAEPVALEFLASDICAFILYYSCAPSKFPTQLVQTAKAISLIRENAAEWNIDPDRIFVCGFSAGGHLAASIGTLWKSHLPQYGFTGEAHKPNGLILGYAAISFKGREERPAYKILLGENPSPELVALMSMEDNVSSDTPPSFIWSTYEDATVPVNNSLLFAQALAKKNVPFELHIYPKGVHGLSLANEIVCKPEKVQKKPQDWIRLAKEWLLDL